jgi:hypothetical protein
MHDLSSDWKRWTLVERVVAVTLTGLVAVGLPIALLYGGALG